MVPDGGSYTPSTDTGDALHILFLVGTRMASKFPDTHQGGSPKADTMHLVDSLSGQTWAGGQIKNRQPA